nr:uncharacterized protein LOC110283143 [Parasteatoda tepidariorum]
MPIREEALETMGESRYIAQKRLNQTVRRLNTNPEMKKLYCEFINEYENLNHMEKVVDDVSPSLSYYMPHHGIFRPDKTSTKLRVVFNASTPTSTGQSLNDILLTGEVRENVFDLIVRFRKHKIALTADIRKMFRQILIDPSQRDLLRILWKTQEDEVPTVIRIKTLTYGTKNAQFLAIRTLKQLAMDEQLNYPLASEVVLSDLYIDDVVTGSTDLESALMLKTQLVKMFDSCGMTLHKWNSNSRDLINDSNFNKEFSFETEESTKTLGIIWQPGQDKFTFKVCVSQQSAYTKRDVLSVIARLYDPIGFLGPVISRAKIMLQTLWTQDLNWDDNLPEHIAREWNRFVSNLKALENIRIDRYVLISKVKKIALVGFADASTLAYGAVIYLHPDSSNSAFKILASKSRIAPLKTISVPR